MLLTQNLIHTSTQHSADTFIVSITTVLCARTCTAPGVGLMACIQEANLPTGMCTKYLDTTSQLIPVSTLINSSKCRSIKVYHSGWFLGLPSSDPCSNLSPPVPPHLLRAPCSALRSFQAGCHHLAEPF